MKNTLHKILRNRFPLLKNVIRDIYQAGSVLVFNPKSELPEGVEVVQNAFFGFHDKSPWSYNSEHIILHKIVPEASHVEIARVATDDLSSNRMLTIGKTRAWNYQQGSMLQWIGSGTEFAYNDFDERDKPVCRLCDINGGEICTLPYHIGASSPNGMYAVSFSFNELGKHMPGYGYSVTSPNSDISNNVFFTIHNLEEHSKRVEVTRDRIKSESQLPSQLLQESFVTHFQFNCNSNKLFFLHRATGKFKALSSELFVYDIDNDKLRNLELGSFISHLNWYDESRILAYANNHALDSYLIINATSGATTALGDGFYSNDGHPQRRPNHDQFVTDSYPDRMRIQELSMFDINSKSKRVIAKVFSPLRFKNEYRCDLHPRWDRSGCKLSIDLVHNNTRSFAVIPIRDS